MKAQANIHTVLFTLENGSATLDAVARFSQDGSSVSITSDTAMMQVQLVLDGRGNLHLVERHFNDDGTCDVSQRVLYYAEKDKGNDTPTSG